MTLLARRAGRRAGTDRPTQTVRELAQILVAYSLTDLHDAVEELRDSAEQPDETWLYRTAAVVVEAFRRSYGIDLFDTQIQAGLVLCDEPSSGVGYVAEMQTGEGKTFAAAFPAVALALHGRGVHVATSNSYLAQRDAEELAPVFEVLDLSVASLPDGAAGASPQDKKAAYQADITYGPGYEFGFDYLRDQMLRRAERASRSFRQRYRRFTTAETSQRPLFAAVIDEVDHVLIDDASSPLVLAAAGAEVAADASVHVAAREFVLSLQSDQLVVRNGRVMLTASAREQALNTLNDGLASRLKRPWLDYITQAAHAEYIFECGSHYIIENDKAQIIDQSTGRIFGDRTWSDGLHQAVEAKEQLPIRDGNRTLARVTRQRFSNLYPRLCGMTGTAVGSEREFRTIYSLDVEAVPTRLPSQRVVGQLMAYASAEQRWDSVVAEVCERHQQGRPILVGTTSISSSEIIAELIREAGLNIELLNGLQDASEAEIVARAGHRGSITVATGIAGRGTDIKLGPGVAEMGGLHVIVSEAQPSVRVERQLVGRAARQGDPGSASRYVSADDPYLALPAPWLADRMKRGHLNVEAAVRRIQRQTDQQASRARIALWNRDRDRDDLVTRLAR